MNIFSAIIESILSFIRNNPLTVLFFVTLGLLLHLATHAVEFEEHKEWYGHDYYAENQQSDQERSEE